MSLPQVVNLITLMKNRPIAATVLQVRQATQTKSGALMPEPPRTPFGLIGVICAVIPGLLIGATISKNIANFLEENDLFVPSDDDDDDD